MSNRNPKKKQDTYIGITENEFKIRYNQHTSSFRLNHNFSEFILKLKESKTEYHLSWDIIERAQLYSAATNRCNLCIAEKCFILKTKPSLNKRREIFSPCPLRKKHLYKTFSGLETKNNSTGLERQPNAPQSYLKSGEDKRHLCPPLETPVSFEENLR